MAARTLGPAPTSLLAAFDELGAGLREVLRSVEDVVPPTRPPAPGDDVTREQFETAFSQVVREGLVGASTEVRDLVFNTAVPGIVADGTNLLDLVETHVAVFALLQRALIQRVAEEERDASARWLAGYFAAYVRDLVDIARSVEEQGR